MTALETHIGLFDPNTAPPEQIAAFHKLRRARLGQRQPTADVPGDDVVDKEVPRTFSFWHDITWLAMRNGVAIGQARVSARSSATPNYEAHRIFLGGGRQIPTSVGGEIFVLNGEDKKQVSRLLLREIFQFMKDTGPQVLTFSAKTPEDRDLLRQLGGDERLHGYIQRVHLDTVDRDLLQRWECIIDTSSPDFRIESFAGRVPQGVLERLLREMTPLYQDMPRGRLMMPTIILEPQTYRDWYRHLDDIGGQHHIVGIRNELGALAGICEVWWEATNPTLAHQNITAVARDWRGRWVAKFLKARMARQLMEVNPTIQVLQTFNSSDNLPMLSINKAMGFGIHAEVSAFQYFTS